MDDRLATEVARRSANDFLLSEHIRSQSLTPQQWIISAIKEAYRQGWRDGYHEAEESRKGEGS